MGYSEIASWCGFPSYWRPWGDFADRHFLERGFGINQIYFFFSMNLRNLHNTQEEESGELFYMKSWLYFSSIAKSSRKYWRFFNLPLAFCGLLSHVKKIVSLMFVSFFYLLMIVCFRFVSVVSRFVSFLLVSFRFVSCFTITRKNGRLFKYSLG